MSGPLYHKINSPFKRDIETKGHPLIMGDWAVPEFEMLQNIWWVAYEKIDGTNIRIIYDGETVTFGGRTERAQIPAHLVNFLKEKFVLELFEDVFPDVTLENPITLYGEGFGHKIQKGGGNYFGGKPEVGFCLFDIRVGHWWLKDIDVDDVVAKLDTFRAPQISAGSLDNLICLVEDGLKSQFGDFYAEGLVAKPILQLFDRSGKRIIIKIKHKDFFEK